ncbi:hypothetical protein HN51_001569, partial [Arachis hypogaea]
MQTQRVRNGEQQRSTIEKVNAFGDDYAEKVDGNFQVFALRDAGDLAENATAY